MTRYLTTSERRFECTALHASPCPEMPEMQLVKVYDDLKFQQVIGFGAALTEASGYVFAQMSVDDQRRFVKMCFGREGNRYSLARLSVQSCDFSLGPRAYVDDSPDESLATFSIDDDFAYVLPLAFAACRENASLEFLASPWSPPAWMKSNATMKHGGRLRKRHYDRWAQMIARFVGDYRALGVPITRLTVQNEPNATQVWESCRFTPSEERAFLVNHLKPALRVAGLGDVKVLGWDHNKESALERTASLLAGDGSRELDGIAFHWYSGDHFEALRVVRDFIGPDKELIFTEGCSNYTAGDPERELPQAENYAHEVIGDLEAGANAILDWNILLDAQGGPNHVGNFCNAPIMHDCESGKTNVRLPFHYLGHFSRFIQLGAVRMLTTRYTTDLETCAFANPDGTHVLVVLNRNWWDIGFDLTWNDAAIGSRIASIEAPAHSIQTICW